VTYPVGPLGQQWHHKTLQTHATMHPDVDTPLNALALRVRTLSGPHLRVASRVGQAVVSGAVFPFELVRDDTDSGWSTVTHKYTVKRDGLYLATALVIADSANTARTQISLDGIPTGRTPDYPSSSFGGTVGSNAAFSRSHVPWVPLHLLVNDVLWITNQTLINTSSSGSFDRHWFELQWVADV
jgi:hypothetical protein